LSYQDPAQFARDRPSRRTVEMEGIEEQSLGRDQREAMLSPVLPVFVVVPGEIGRLAHRSPQLSPGR
jgi:hypothetical protein